MCLAVFIKEIFSAKDMKLLKCKNKKKLKIHSKSLKAIISAMEMLHRNTFAYIIINKLLFYFIVSKPTMANFSTVEMSFCHNKIHLIRTKITKPEKTNLEKPNVHHFSKHY